MSRSGYSDDCDDCDGWALIRWRGAVNSAIKGKRGQQALREIVAALDALPEKRLASESLVNADGEYCALGALGRARGISMKEQDPEDVDPTEVARTFGIAMALAAEIMYLNDDCVSDTMWIDIEIFGPMRPHYPDWSEHKRSISVPNHHAAEKRWRYMRSWAAMNIQGDGK